MLRLVSTASLALAMAALLSGCMWGAVAVTAVMLSADSGGSSSSDPPAVEVALLSTTDLEADVRKALEAMGATIPEKQDQTWCEGIVPFRVTLRGPTSGGSNTLRLAYLGADATEHEFKVGPACFSDDGQCQTLSPEWRIPAETAENWVDRRIVLWDTTQEDLQAQGVNIIARWGRAKGVSRSVFLDSGPIPAITVCWMDDRPADGTCKIDPYKAIFSFRIGAEPRDSCSKASLEKEKIPAGRLAIELEVDVKRSLSTGPRTIMEPQGVDATALSLESPEDERILEWDSAADFSDDHVEVQLRMRLRRQQKWGCFVPFPPGPRCADGSTHPEACLRIDNRMPRPLSTDRRRIPNDKNFSLTVSGSGFSWEAQTKVWLTKDIDGREAVDFATVRSVKPLSVGGSDLPSTKDLEYLRGPSGFIVQFEVQEPESPEAYCGPVYLWVQNPNGRCAALQDPLFAGPSQVSFSGPFPSLLEKPLDVAAGHFIPDPGVLDDSTPYLDVAVITATKPPVLTMFAGDGTGNFPDRWFVNLATDDAEARAVAAVTLEKDRRSGVLVATTNSLEFVQSNERGHFEASPSPPELVEDQGPRGLAVADFNGDSVPDAAVSSPTESRVDFFSGTSSGNAPISFKWSGCLKAGFPRSLAAADFDLDGRSDLVVLAEKGGSPTLLLFLSKDFEALKEKNCEGTPDPSAELAISDAGCCIAASDDSLFDDNSYPDILLTLRSDEVTRIFVTPTSLERHPRSGSVSGTAMDIALINLPGGETRKEPFDPPLKAEILDFVTVDAGSKAMTATYTTENGIENSDFITYPLPGEGQAIAVGDLDGDKQEDVIAVTAEPNALAILLANPATDGVEKDPLYYPDGWTSGEEPLRTPGALGIAFGYADKEKTEPFLAIVSRVRDEVAVFFLDPLTSAPLREERYRNVGKGVRSLLVADLDGRDGDDIVVAASKARKVLFLRNVGRESDEGSSRFKLEEAPLLDIASGDPCIPEDVERSLGSDETGFRIMAAGPLDLNPLPDLVIPITLGTIGGTTQKISEDYIAVLLNPGAGTPSCDPSSAATLYFYKTLDDPRHVCIANLNGDSALDLGVALEGTDLNFGNSVQVFFGDPAAPGTFIPRECADHPLCPIQLRGIEPIEPPEEPLENQAGCEVEYVVTDSLPPDWHKADWIVVSNSQVASMYWNSTQDPLEPKFCHPLKIYEGGDPETILVHDLFPDADGIPRQDTAILEEGKGELVFTQNLGDVPDETAEEPSCRKILWRQEGLPFDVGSPQDIASFWRKDAVTGKDILTLAVVSRSEQRIILLERDCLDDEKGCTFSRARVIPLEEPDISGRHTGLAVAKCPEEDGSSGGFLVASLVEDALARLGTGAVDFLALPASPEVAPWRLAVDGEPAAVLLGGFRGRKDELDLLVLDASGTLTCYPMCQPGIPWEQRFTFSFQQGDAGQLAGAVGVELVQDSPAASVLAVGTESQAHLVSLDELGRSARIAWTLPSAKAGIQSIRRIAHGWLDADRRQPFLAVMGDQRLVVAMPEKEGEDAPIALVEEAGKLGVVGVRDVNLDGRDDIAVIDGPRATLSLFLALEAGSKDLFAPAQVTRFPPAQPVDLTFLDANGDQLPDVAFGAKNGEIFTFLGNGDGTFGDQQEFYAGPMLEAIRSLDIEGDGKDEIVASVATPGFVLLRTMK